MNLETLCELAFALNVMGRNRTLSRWQSQVYYRIKNVLVEYLYRRGKCIEAGVHVQERECWGCFGDGCDRCNGTGVYATTRLYSFAFKIGKRVYRWHQPEQYVTWPVKLTDAKEMPYSEPAPMEIAESGDPSRLAEALWYHLALRLLLELRWRMLKDMPELGEIRMAFANRVCIHPDAEEDDLTP
jgi:hypothetical protein